MNTIDLNGNWVGTLWYDGRYGLFKGKELHFSMKIEQDNNKIQGIAQDIKGFGVHPKPAQIEGEIIEDQVSFIKQYPTSHYVGLLGGVKIKKLRPGPEIYYSGYMSEKEEAISGKWEMTAMFYILGLILWTSKETGTWTMKRSTENNS